MHGLKLVGLLGRSRAGKDTVANILSRELGFPIVRLSMPVKKACSELFDIPLEDLDSHAKEIVDPRYGKTPRDLLVWMTTAVQMEFPSHFFIDRLLETCSALNVKGVIIPDVRFEYDANAIRLHGGTIVKITRKDAPVFHAHEDSIDALRGDIIVENDATIYELERKARGLAFCLE